jgi:hypothetical protein
MMSRLNYKDFAQHRISTEPRWASVDLAESTVIG